MPKKETEKTEDSKEKETPEKIVVVQEYPKVPTNVVDDEEGNPVKLLSLTEAITEIYNDVKEIKQVVG